MIKHIIRIVVLGLLFATSAGIVGLILQYNLTKEHMYIIVLIGCVWASLLTNDDL